MQNIPSCGQTMLMFFWLEMRAKAMLVMPMWYRPSSTALTTSSGLPWW
jgi:hypothetical protein